MSGKRTGGMATLGIAHIGIGALGVLASCVLLIVWVTFLFPSHLVAIAGPIATVLPKKSLAVLGIVLAVLRAVAGVLLIVAGVRVLDVAPAGRKLSMTAAFLWTFVNVTDFFALDLFVYKWSIAWFLASNGYPLVIEMLFLRRDWRVAFSGEAA